MATGPRYGVDRAGPILLGVVLILVGVAWLLGGLFNVDVGRYGWPLFIIVPGAILLLAGLAARHDAGIGLSVAGSTVLATGLILAVQNLTGWWASWAYAWALIAPGGIGLGLMLSGWRLNRPALHRNGGRSALAGLALFVAGFVFFEGLIGIDGRSLFSLSGTAWAVLLIAAGVVWLVVSLLRRGPGARPIADN